MLATEVPHDESAHEFVLHVPWQEHHEKVCNGHNDVNVINGVSKHEDLNIETEDGLEEVSDCAALSYENVHELTNKNLTDEADEETNVVFRFLN
jgi:hypothetical protein